MLQDVKTTQDVVTFIEDLAKEIGDYNPVAEFGNYIDTVTNQPMYTNEEAALRNRLLEKCFVVCGQQSTNFIHLFILMLEEAKNNVASLQSQLTIIHNRERKDYFNKCYTVVDVKTRYLQLADDYNFYRGGDAKTIQHIQELYAEACDNMLIEEATSEEDFLEQFDRVQWYIDVVALLLSLPALKIEVANGYLCVRSSDYNVEIELRKAGLACSRSDGTWYYRL